MKRKSWLLLLVVILIATLLFVGCSDTSAPAPAEEQGEKEEEKSSGPIYLNITTATTGGTYYPIGVGMATLWTDELRSSHGISVSAQSSAGTVENIDIMRKKEAEMGIMQGLGGAMAYTGADIFEGNAYTDMRSISALWFNVEHFALAASASETGNVMDIVGKRFCVGSSGSGTEQSTLTIMKGLGLSTDDITAERLDYSQTAEAMKDDRIDGGSFPGGTPVASISDLYASQLDTVVLDFTDEQLEAINNVFPSWGRWVIPAGMYTGQDKEINSIAQPNWLAIRSDVDEEIVYLLTKTLFENTDYVAGVHAAGKQISLDTAFVGVPVPLHEGAYRYFQEVGVEVPENLMPVK